MSDFTLYTMAPARVLAPATAEELAGCLREASAAGQTVLPWGGGTRQQIGAPPAGYDIALSTAGLRRVVEYSPADLVLRVEAGATLAEVQAALAPHGQWLPWDPPLPARASVGGLLASGASGPLRLGYGSPRDWTLGMRVALADGRLVKSGAKVVKNVAGYDAHKLHIGAFGTLGVIVEATFKLAPLPPNRQTLLASFSEPRAPLAAIAQLRDAPLQPISLVVLNDLAEQSLPALHSFVRAQPSHMVVVARFAGTAGAVARQIREAVRRCVEIGAHTIELNDADDGPLWAAIADFSAPAGTLLLRLGAPLGAIDELGRLLEQIPRGHGWPSARMLVAGVGLAYCRLDVAGAPADAILATLGELRAGLAAVGGYTVVEEAPAWLAAQLDAATIWGPPPEALPLMRALRAAWDPAGILNRGRYLV